MIAVLDRAVFSEVLKTLLAFLLVVLVLLLSHTFIQILEWVSLGRAARDTLLELLGLQMLHNLSRLTAPATFFAMLFVLGRLYRDSEVTALQACGVTANRLYRAIFAAALPIALVTAWLTLVASPWAAQRLETLKAQQQGRAAELAGIMTGRFNEYSGGDLVLYIEEQNKAGEMSGLFVQHRQPETISLVTAERGYTTLDAETGDLFLVLLNGRRYAGLPGQAEYAITQFDEYGLRIEPQEVQPRQRNAAIPSSVLWQAEALALRAELQERLAYPLSVLILALVSIPLSRSAPRQGASGRLLVAFLVYFLFLNLQGAAKDLMESGVTPSWIGTWWVHLPILGIAFLFTLGDRVWVRRGLRRWRSRRA